MIASFAVSTKSHRLACRNVVRGSRLSSTYSIVTDIMMKSNVWIVQSNNNRSFISNSTELD